MDKQDVNCQKEYWDSVAGSKTFTHEPDIELIKANCTHSDKILDVGFGYGRLAKILTDDGFSDISGLEISSAMAEVARKHVPDINVKLFDGGLFPFDDNTFDLVLSFAVLNCIPSNEGQERHINEALRVLKPGGLYYLSDVILQTDEKSILRYKEYENKYGEYGTFELPEGVVLRHTSEIRLKRLVRLFKEIYCGVKESKSMNGNTYSIFQYLGQKRA